MAALCATAIPLALLTIPGVRTHDMLARQYRTELTHAAPERIAELLEGIAALGETGLPLLVEAACSHDDLRVVAADRLLREQLDRWQSLTPRAARVKVAHLAHLLAQRAGQGSAESKRRTAELCTRILLWPTDRSDDAAAELLTDCETVLRARIDVAAEVRRRQDVDKSLAEAQPKGDSRAHPSITLEPDTATVVPTPIDPSVAGAAQPSETLESQPTFVSINTPSLSASNDNTRFKADTELRLNEPSSQLSHGRWLQPNQLEPKLLNDSASATSSTVPGLDEPTDRAVMLQLLDEDARVVAEAAGELRRRGYTATHIALAGQLVSPDPNVRLALVETLPRIGAFDPRLWLIWLTRDAEPAVRKAAIAVIATSNDPVLRNQLATCEQEELDPEVLRFVRRVRMGQRTQ